MADLLLGIDIGTSACKAAVFTLDGQVAAQCSEEYEVFYPQPGWAEQNPDDWWKAVCASIQRIGQQGIPLEEVRAVESTAKAGPRFLWTVKVKYCIRHRFGLTLGRKESAGN